jgi:AcrR family transcriptional regulator
MDAARRLFLKRGVESTTIEQIASGAQVAKGTFYLYFSSKEDVLRALHARFGEEHFLNIKAAVDKIPSGDWKGKLAAWAGASVNTYLDSVQLHDVLFFGPGPHTREGLVENAVIDHLSGLLEAGAEANLWFIPDARSAAVFLFSGTHALIDDAYLKEKRVNRKRLTHRLRQLCFRTLGRPAP